MITDILKGTQAGLNRTLFGRTSITSRTLSVSILVVLGGKAPRKLISEQSVTDVVCSLMLNAGRIGGRI